MKYPQQYEDVSPDDIPYGYSVYPDEWGNGSSYAVSILPDGTDDRGHGMILIASAPGRYSSATLVNEGPLLAQVMDLILLSVAALRVPTPQTPESPL